MSQDYTPEDLQKQPSKEVPEMIKLWCKMQQEKYGPDWKKIVAAELTAAIPEELKHLLVKKL